jgi:serine/threonine protein kinase
VCWRGLSTPAFSHVEDHLADPAKVYRAPEAAADGDEGAARIDVFSLGAIAYHILSGRPPVASPLDLPSRLREGNGLLLSGAMNGAGRWLEEMVRVSTTPVVRDRPRDAREFLDYLRKRRRRRFPPSLLQQRSSILRLLVPATGSREALSLSAASAAAAAQMRFSLSVKGPVRNWCSKSRLTTLTPTEFAPRRRFFAASTTTTSFGSSRRP